MSRERGNLAGARDRREIPPLRRPTRSRTNEGKRRRPAGGRDDRVFFSSDDRRSFRVVTVVFSSGIWMSGSMSNSLHCDVKIPMDVRGALRTGISRLREKQIASYTLAAELLLLHVLGRDRAWLYAHPEEQVNSQQLEAFLSLISRRTNGEPAQHLTGKQEFWSLE